MKKILFLVALIAVLGFTNKDTFIENTAFKIIDDSTLSVIGTSNVKGFECKYDMTDFKSVIPINYILKDGKILLSESTLVLDNINFDCGGRAINRDFIEILKTKKHPRIKLELREINMIHNKNEVNVLVDVSMAGISNTYSIPVNLKKNDKLEVVGNLDLYLDTFNIEAPNKLFGLIQIGNHVEIEFKLFLKEIISKD
ncbi:hypothetical protein KO493_13910 [Tamlana agarivorans]|uniref:Uncharacterized protein n=1 Tax=Pseudotamlana agarivorans TaxID=481183 RepID=A0ACC5UC74_9FLAO|nr:hypothetical protein [Tamlana agarivorans]MBU2951790.1 hypothetical protein [Tamlana agarivorans]